MNRTEKKRLFRFAVDYFIASLNTVTKGTTKYKCNDADVKSWDIFCEHFGERVAESFIHEYVQYGMNSWFYNGVEKDYSRTIRFNWVFGNKGIERWSALKPGVRKWCVRASFKKDYGVVAKPLNSALGELVVKVRAAEERMKAEFFNTKRGLLWCVANTTLYNHRSSHCAICENKQDCKTILKDEFPKIYVARGYGKK